MAAAPAPKEVDRYLVESAIGRGGFGTVYRARHAHTGHLVALKLARSDDADALRRLVREARILASVRHRNVVQVLDAGFVDGLAFVVMELLQGESLQARLARERTLPLRAALSIARQVLAGLEAAHAAGVVHRDIKPANLMLMAGGIVKIVDFGISRSSSVAATAATAGHWQGTPGYIAPEQLRGGAVDGRADVYSTAATLFCMLAGERPFPGTDLAVALLRTLNEPAPSLAERTRNIPAPVVAAVDRALQRDPSARFSSAAEFARALSEEGTTDLPQFRYAWAWALLPLVGIAAGAGAFVALAQSNAPRAPLPAPTRSAASPAPPSATALEPEATASPVDAGRFAPARVRDPRNDPRGRTGCSCRNAEASHPALCKAAGARVCRCENQGTFLCAVPWTATAKGNVTCPMGDARAFRRIEGAVPGGSCSGYDNATSADGLPTSPRRDGRYGCYACDPWDESYSGREGDRCSGADQETGAPRTGTLSCPGGTLR